MLKRLRLRSRMIFYICSIVTVAFAVTIALVAYRASDIARTESLKRVGEMARHQGGKIRAEIETALHAARTLAQAFEGVKAAGVPQRRVMDCMLKQVLAQNPGFLGVWTCWEPNALDGRDSEFAGTPGHDGSGRYVPYWHRNAGSINVSPLADYTHEGNGGCYLAVRNSGKETIADPYVGKVDGTDVLITSLAVPVRFRSVVIATVGVDIKLTHFKDIVGKIKPFETGYAFLVSNTAQFVAHPKQEVIGGNMKNYKTPQKILDAVLNGKQIDISKKALETGKESYVLFEPIQIGHTTTPWSLALNIPMEKVMAQAHALIKLSILIGMAFLVILTVVTAFMAKGISDPINQIASDLNENAEQVLSASLQIASSGQSLAEGASEQAASIEETSATLEQISSMTSRNADNANQADALMKDVNSIVKNANESMQELTASIDEVARATEETHKIIKTIDEIAFQTNLLALNAAVEAARAGEAGAGFAVVAEEVRNLALRSADAAKNTAGLIEGTVNKVHTGSSLVSKTNDAFGEVVGSSRKVGELIGEIAAASNEQAQGIQQVNTAVVEMDKVTQENASNAEESASASEEMNAQAAQLKGLVACLVTVVNGAGKGRKQNQTGIEAESEKTAESPLNPSDRNRLIAQSPEIRAAV